MNENDLPLILEINKHDYEGLPRMVFCPVCQALVINEEEFYECAHTLFVTAAICDGEYLYAADSFAGKISRTEMTSTEERGDYTALWKSAGYGSELVVVAQNNYGSGQGPEYKMFIGFDCTGGNITEDTLKGHKKYILSRAAELTKAEKEYAIAGNFS
ncbi:MAG: hypothetical protein ACM3Q2_13025 [Syntrophothermus sp.]